ncbi:MAG: hypothetical protein PHY28_09355 [Dehalococcoidales bacterium]|nr:hypothetical protein [Dehalococcoidales bacterium]
MNSDKINTLSEKLGDKKSQVREKANLTLASAYKTMAKDERREQEALEWAEAAILFAQEWDE